MAKVIVVNPAKAKKQSRNPITKEGKIKPLPKNLQKMKPGEDGKYKHRPVFHSASRGHLGQRSEKKVLQNKKHKSKIKKNGVSMPVVNKKKTKKPSYKNPANPVANKKKKKPSYRNPSYTNSFSGSGVMETAVDGVMVAGSGIVIKKVPDWIGGILPDAWQDNVLVKYGIMLALTLGGGYLLNSFGQKRIAKNLVIGGVSAITLTALEQFFPDLFGPSGKFAPRGTMSRIVVTPQGQMLLKGDDGEYQELSAGLTPEELAQQQRVLAMQDTGRVVAVPAPGGGGGEGLGNIELTDGDSELVEGDEEIIDGDEMELVEGDEDLEGLNDYSYGRGRVSNQYNYS